MNPIRTLIVDDEPSAREGLNLLLKDDPEIEIVAVCKNGVEAIQEIKEKKPDLLLLDIQMPGVDGFDVLTNIWKDNCPYIVFITAHDEYALKAFEFHALDYLLKPFPDDRFFDMMQRVKHVIKEKKIIRNIENISRFQNKLESERDQQKELFTMPPDNDRQGESPKIVIKDGSKIHLISQNEILYVEAYDYYIKIYREENFLLTRMSLKRIEEELSTTGFIRIHRSYIININYLKRIERSESGNYTVIMINQKELPVSQTYRNLLLNRIKK